MTYYVMTRDQSMVGLLFINPYNEDFANIDYHEVDGTIPDLNTNEWNIETDEFKLKENSKILTKLEFLNKFSIQERITINNSTDQVVIDMLRMFNVAEYINLDDPNIIQALQYFMSIGIITPERYSELVL